MPEKDKNQELEVFSYLAKGDKFVLYLYQKTSKIAYAIYLVTDFIKDTEPLKWTLRKNALDTMSLKNFFDEKSVFKILRECLLELEGTLELARAARVVSEMNTNILHTEIKRVVGEIGERSFQGFHSSELIPSFFDVSLSLSEDREQIKKDTGGQYMKPAQKNSFYKGHKGQDVLYKTNKSFTKIERLKGEGITTLDEAGKESKGQRLGQILNIIKNRGSVTIKDIVSLIKDCSEKTIQRELLHLVQKGQLKKTGERRWSTYSLIA